MAGAVAACPGGGGAVPGRLPDAQVGAPGVVAPHRGHSARVGADVARPGLGDVEGAVGIHPHTWDRLDVDHGSLLFPDVPGTETGAGPETTGASEPAKSLLTLL